MSTYEDNLQQTVSTTLSNVYAEEQKRKAQKEVANHSLYYAIGQRERAQDKLNQVNRKYDETHYINGKSVVCINTADGLLETVEAADENVSTTITNTATAAANVQAAAHAVLKVAGGMGSTNNIVGASDAATDIQELAAYTNKVMRSTAYTVEKASALAMQASADAAQITAKDLVSKATTTKATFTDLRDQTNADLDELTQERTTDTSALAAANTDMRHQEGLLGIAIDELKAVVQSYNTVSQALNYGLQVTKPFEVENGEKQMLTGDLELNTVHVRFEPLLAPFPYPKEPGSKIFSMLPLQKMNNKYYVAVAKEDKASLFSPDVAQMTFSNNQKTRFLQLKPGRKGHNINLGTQTDNTLPFLENDVEGDQIKPGTNYVMFLYIDLDSKYQKITNDFEDFLSAPTEKFKLAQTLPDVFSLDPKNYTPENDPSGLLQGWKYTFNVNPIYQPGKEDGNNIVEYRCMLVPYFYLPQFTGEVKELTIDEPLEIAAELKRWFTKEVALKVSPTNYFNILPKNRETSCTFSIEATPKEESKILPMALRKEDAIPVSTQPLETDNFGQLLKAANDTELGLQEAYALMVLSIVPPTTTDAKNNNIADHYRPKLTCLLTTTPPPSSPVDPGKQEPTKEEKEATKDEQSAATLNKEASSKNADAALQDLENVGKDLVDLKPGEALEDAGKAVLDGAAAAESKVAEVADELAAATDSLSSKIGAKKDEQEDKSKQGKNKKNTRKGKK